MRITVNRVIFASCNFALLYSQTVSPRLEFSQIQLCLTSLKLAHRQQGRMGHKNSAKYFLVYSIFLTSSGSYEPSFIAHLTPSPRCVSGTVVCIWYCLVNFKVLISWPYDCYWTDCHVLNFEFIGRQ